jgi:hypothetical protein
MTLKQEVSMLRTEVKELRLLTLQQAKLTEELSIIIKGSESLGVEGIRVLQRREAVFKEKVLTDFADFQKKLDENSNVIRELRGMENSLREVVEWKATWTRAIGLISSSTTWKVLFFVGMGIAGVVIFAKFKLFGLVQGFEQLIKK